MERFHYLRYFFFFFPKRSVNLVIENLLPFISTVNWGWVLVIFLVSCFILDKI